MKLIIDLSTLEKDQVEELQDSISGITSNWFVYHKDLKSIEEEIINKYGLHQSDIFDLYMKWKSEFVVDIEKFNNGTIKASDFSKMMYETEEELEDEF